MAEKRTIDINIKNNADEATKDFKQFNDALDETAKSAKNVNSTFEEVYGDLQPLTTRLGEAEDRLYELALAGDTTSKEYQELLTKVGEYRKVQIQTDLAVDGAATTMTQKLGSALNATTSGFAATQGAIALFGKENEALEESLLKVQSALAIQQGVQGLTEAYRELAIGTKIATAAKAAYSLVVGTTTGVLKAFRIALVSTGIGAIVVAIGLLIANFDKIAPVVKKVIDVALMPMKLIIDGLISAYYALTDALGITSKAEREREKQAVAHAKASRKRNQQLMEEYRKEKEAIENNIEATKNYQKAQEKRYDRQIELLQAEGKETRKIEKLKLQLNVETQKQILQDRIKGLKEAQKTNNKITKIFAKVQLGAQKERLKQAQFEELKFEKETNKIKLDNYREYQKNRLDIARQIEDLENELLEDGIEKELEINRDKFRRLREDAEKNTELTLTERRRLNDLYTEQEAKSEAEIRDKFRKEALKEEIDFFNKNKLPILKAQADEEVSVEVNKWSLIGQAQAEAYKKEEALRKRNQDFAVQTTLDGLSLISDITELFGKKGEKQAKRAFQVQKAAQIAAATIETYRSAQAAYLSQFLPVPDPSSPVRGGIAAGVAVAAGIANIAKIASQKFEGGGATGGGADFSGGGVGGGEVVSPEFNVVGDAGINQLAQLQQQPTQAYVVSGEVTSAQALDRNRVTNATL